MQPAFCLVSLIWGIGIVVMIGISQESEPGYQFYYAGVMMVITGNYTIMRLKFRNAIIAGLTMVLAYEFVAIFFNGMLEFNHRIPIFINNNFFLLATNIVGILACFTIEYYIRNDFLLRKQISLESEMKLEKAQNEIVQAKDTIVSIERENEVSLQNISHSIKNKHAVQYAFNNVVNGNLDNLFMAAALIRKKLPYVLNKTTEKALLTYEELIKSHVGGNGSNNALLGLLQRKRPEIILKLIEKNKDRLVDYLVQPIRHLDENLHQSVADSFDNMDNILDYIYAILNYQRGKQISQKKNVFTDLRKIYKHLIETYHRQLEEYNIEFEYISAVKDHVRIRIYDFILEDDILRNLFNNSFRALSDHMPAGMHRRKITIKVVSTLKKENRDYYRIDFLDNGPGIPESKKELIFSGYSSRVKGSKIGDTEEYDEHGVGGITIRKRIEEVRGTIIETGEYGRGAHFVMHLPKYSESEMSEIQLPGFDVELKRDGTVDSTLFDGRHVLIVDDSEAIRNSYLQMLESTPLKISTVGTLSKAREFIFTSSIPIDVIILDLDLGAEKGETLLEELKGKTESFIPVIVASGSDRAQEFEQMAELMAKGVLSKPFKKEDLIEALRKIFNEEREKFRTSKMPFKSRTVTKIPIPSVYKTKKILVVDDERFIRKSIAYTFDGLSVHEAVNVTEAKSLIMEEPIDLVILDIDLGDENGTNLLLWMRNREMKTPVIVLSGTIEDEKDANQYTELGANYALAKPVDQNRLLSYGLNELKR
ncbi:MAG: response regulator [Spirochaetales bacterium]|nr:response regulator [Spirochaetales bacterium]